MRVFVHQEPYGRFVSCLVFVPRDRYTTPVRLRIAKRLIDAFGASSYEWNAHLTESVLARLHFVLRVDPAETLERRSTSAISRPGSALASRTWGDDLRDTLVNAHGEEAGLDLLRVWGSAFPAAYQEEFTATEALRRPDRARSARNDRRARDGSSAGRRRPTTSTSSSTASARSLRSPTCSRA